MPWYFPWSDALKKRACRYLLQHYLGHFLKEKLSLEQLSVDIYKGTGVIQDLLLDVQSLNDALDSCGVPLELVDGFVGKISITIPWNSLLTENTHVEISNLEVTVQPKQREEAPPGVMLESMLSSSMTTSMQLAEECLRQDQTLSEHTEDTPFEGLEMFAQTIERVLSRVKLTLIDTIVRLEHLPCDARTGAALEVRISRMEYFDEMAGTQQQQQQQAGAGAGGVMYEPPAVAVKNIQVMGLNVYCEEFAASSRTFSRYSEYAGESPSPTSHPIQVAAFSGRQDMKLKIKQAMHAAAPKLEVECKFGSLNVHLSPRQLHLVLEILQGLSSPDLCDNSNTRCANKPMDEADFYKVERDLQNHLRGLNIGASAHMPPQQMHYLGDDEGEEVYFSMDDPSHMGSMQGSYSSSASSRTGSTMSYNIMGQRKPESSRTRTSSASSKMHKDAYRQLEHDGGPGGGTGAERTRFHAKLSFLSVLLLHEDPSPPPHDPLDEEMSPGGGAQQQRLLEMADKYFGRVKGINVAGQSVDIAQVRDEYSQACPFDHIGLLCKPVTMECNSRWSGSTSTSSVEVTVGRAEVVEAVYDRHRRRTAAANVYDYVPPEYCQLLTFVNLADEETNMFTSTVAHPCLRIKVDSQNRKSHGSSSSSRHSSPPNKTDIHVELTACCTEVDITIVDRINALLNPQPLSPGPTLLATQQLQSDLLLSTTAEQTAGNQRTELHISCPSISLCLRFPVPDLREGPAKQPWWRRCLRDETLMVTMLDADIQTCLTEQTKVVITCRQAHGYFQEKQDEASVAFLHVGAVSTAENDDGFEWPRIVVRLFPEHHSVLDIVDEAPEADPDSLNGACQFPHPANSPFSSRKEIYDSNEMVMPADRAEMNKFADNANNNCQINVELNLPCVNAQIKSKAFFELLYNRIINDLVLWTPEAGSSHAGSIPQDPAAFVQHFSMCKSALHPESSSSSEDEEDEASYQYHHGASSVSGRTRVGKQSYMCLQLNITKGTIQANTKLTDEHGEPVSQPGELVLHVGDASLTMASKFEGDPTLSYLAIRSNTASLFDQGKSVLSLSEQGIVTKLQGNVGMGGDSHDQLALAMSIRSNEERKLKEYVVAVGLKGTTLRHRPANCSWLDQVMELFDVKDYPISGYTLPQILSEIHVHIWSCAIDYRPLYLPCRALVTIETFSICTNLLAESNMSVLNFTVDNAALYLSDRVHEKAVDLRRNYVCVLDVGLFTLCVRTTNGTDPRHPKVHFRAANNIIHLRTCSDSLQCLAALINYLATHGDLQPPPSQQQGAPSVAEPAEPTLSASTPDSDTQDSIPDLMADAMEEEEEAEAPQACATHGGKLYFEAPAMDRDADGSDVVTMHFDDSCYRDKDEPEDLSGDEFCIIEDPGPASARDGDHGVRAPDVKQRQPQLKNTHYSLPLGTTDLLSAPDHYPTPTHRYTVAEFSLVWYMYGGKDFSHSQQHSHTGSGRGRAAPPPGGGGGKLGWQARGGPERDINVLMELQLNKVRLSYEKYPEHTVQASRQVLLIKEVEVRDRLASSKINKFLYLYSSDKLPRQSRANMLMIKALHQRPGLEQPQSQPSTAKASSAEECSLRVSMQPLRLNIDQDALFFLKTFFMELTETEHESSGDVDDPPPPEPVMQMGGEVAGADSREPAPLIMFDEMSDNDDEDETNSTASAQSSQPVFIKHFVFSPEVQIRLDYQGKRVSMEHGKLTGLLVGLAQLNCSELKLKRINHVRGLLGIQRVLGFVLNEWLHDIKTRQLPSILGGVGPMHSLVQLVQGIVNLVWMPIEQYRRDGRLVRGLQRGTSSFLTSTAMSVLELTNKMVQIIQSIGEVSFDLMNSGPSVRKRKREKWRRTLNQPADLREGVTNACNIVTEGLKGTAENLVNVAKKEHEQKGVPGAVGGVLRQVPPTILQPVLIATEATSNILGGMRNQLLPEKKREDEEKWKPGED